MREASFILPLADNHGHEIEWLHEELVTVLVLRFGGCAMANVNVASAVKGLLRTTPSREYRVVAEWVDGEAERDLLNTAKLYAKRAAQKVLVFKTMSGTVLNYDIEGN